MESAVSAPDSTAPAPTASDPTTGPSPTEPTADTAAGPLSEATAGLGVAETAPAVFAGVDSGGTRTSVQAAVRTGDGPVLNVQYEVGRGLSGVLDEDLVPEVMREVLEPLAEHVDDIDGGPLPVFVWFSAAGFAHRTRQVYVEALTTVIAESRLEIQLAGAANDGVSLLLGSGADGAVIAGTGSTVLVRGLAGSVQQVGGHEWVACDFGSGFWIGLHAIRQAHRDWANGAESLLVRRFCETYSIPRAKPAEFVAALRALAVAGPTMKLDIARFAHPVCEAARDGDRNAQDIVRSEAESLAEEVASALRDRYALEQGLRGCRLVQCGSLLANEFYRACFEQHLAHRLLGVPGLAVPVSWSRSTTGQAEALALAYEIADDPHRFDALDDLYRPAVVAR